MISAEVIGRLGLACGNVCDKGLLAPTGDDGVDDPPPLPPDTILLDGDRFIIFNPSARFTLLVGDITTWFGFELLSPLLSWLE